MRENGKTVGALADGGGAEDGRAAIGGAHIPSSGPGELEEAEFWRRWTEGDAGGVKPGGRALLVRLLLLGRRGDWKGLEPRRRRGGETALEV